MIAKIPPKRKDGKSSFKDLINYCLGITGHEDNSVLHVGFQNINSAASAWIEMEALATDNTRCKDPVFHFILSWREMENPTSEQVDEAVKIALKELDLENCQALWALQANTENLHAHVAVNRIDPETGRAIQPAGNWTYKALERAARKIEATQNWEIEQTGRYVVTADGQIKEKNERAEPEVSQKSRDIEAHTGAKSIERLAQEMAAPILKTAGSWRELHEQLAEKGFSFEKKGSGAILKYKDIALKVSKASRECSFSKLLKRLGEFEELRSEDLKVAATQPVPVEKIASEKKLERSWKGYIEQKTAYLEAKKKALKDLKEEQKIESENLWKKQKAEREALFKESWKGRGNELNKKRSILAAAQQVEKLNLRDKQTEGTLNIKSRFLNRFPNFENWLKEQEDEQFLILYRYPGQTVLTPEQSGATEKIKKTKADIRNYTALNNGLGIAYYRENDRKNADFIDYGRRIVINKDNDEISVLAALQLANQKWGAAQINGTDEKYRQLCVQIAIKHNLKLSNPDLKKAVEEGRQKMQEQTTTKAKTIFESYARAVGAERFRILVTEFQPDGTKAFVFDRNNGGLDGKTAEELIKDISRLDQYAKSGKNINVFPASKDKHHILVDDLTKEKLEGLKADGYCPSCVIESSPGNFQAILTVQCISSNTEKDRIAANKLTKELNQKYGDPKLSGAVHAHRLPPFQNFKPKHQKEDGAFPETVLTEAEGGICGRAREELYRIQQEIIERQRKNRQQVIQQDTANDPNGAYWAHYRDIMKRQHGNDYSVIDGMIGVRMRVTGYSSSQIQMAIRENAPAIRRENMTGEEYTAKYQYRDWARFAKETTENFVFGVRGEVQFNKAEAYRPYFIGIEGRRERTQQKKAKSGGIER